MILSLYDECCCEHCFVERTKEQLKALLTSKSTANIIPNTSFSSNEINFLIYRYLKESGYPLSAYVFGNESNIVQSNIECALVPQAALVSIVQKGVQFTGAQLCAADDTKKRPTDALSLIEAVKQDIATKFVTDNRRDGANPSENGRSRLNKCFLANDINGISASAEAAATVDSKADVKMKEKPITISKGEPKKSIIIANSKTIKVNPGANPTIIKMDSAKKCTTSSENISVPLVHQQATVQSTALAWPLMISPVNTTPTVANVVSHTIAQMAINIPQQQQHHKMLNHLSDQMANELSLSGTILKGHESEVFYCAWNPSNDTLASGSADCTARIWNTHDPSSHTTLPHCSVRSEAIVPVDRDVTSISWNNDGTLLATGCYDGFGRIWNTSDGRFRILDKHIRAIFALKWNKKGQYIVTAGEDKTTVIWDALTGTCKQQFDFHNLGVTDVDWQTNHSFASCSRDTQIHVCKLGNNRPVKTFEGHQGGVNAIKWCPTGSLLASCSADQSVKVWSMDQDNPVHDFINEHKKAVYKIDWSNTGRGTANPNVNLMLASASIDSTARLWDVERGKCLYTLQHSKEVFSVAFLPDGRFLASGGFDKWVKIWCTQSGDLVKYCESFGNILHVCWNAKGDKVAASTSDGAIVILELRK